MRSNEPIRRSKAVVVSKLRRRQSPLEADTQGPVGHERRRPGIAGCPCLEVNRDTEHPAGEFSPGKNELDPDDGDAPAVSSYGNRIGASWRRVVQDVMEVARLCAEASARLTAAQKSELMAHLPFRRATFSKLAQIGADSRLNAPEIQRLLPPHYTTMYAVTLLNDEELIQAFAEKVLHPDLKRVELQKWHSALPRKVGRVPSSQEVVSDFNDGGNSPSLASPKDASNEKRSTAAVGGQTGPAVRSSDVMHDAVVEEAVSPATMPTSLDRRPLNAEDQRAFDAIMAAWAKSTALRTALVAASPVVRERFFAVVRVEIASVCSASR